MTKNAHVGSSFESWLEEKGLREEVTAAAIKAVIAAQIGEEMQRNVSARSKWPSGCRPVDLSSTGCSTRTKAV